MWRRYHDIQTTPIPPSPTEGPVSLNLHRGDGRTGDFLGWSWGVCQRAFLGIQTLYYESMWSGKKTSTLHLLVA